MFDLLSKIKNKILKKIYFRKFKNYRDASRFCNKINKDNYENNFLNEYRLKKFLINEKDHPFINAPSYKFLNDSISFYLSKYNSFPKILDIGGSFGESALYLRNIFKGINIKYSILESKKIVELSNQTKNNIKFYDCLELALQETKPDLIFSSSTLQYLSEPYKVIDTLNKSNAKMISLTRNSFSDNTYFFSQVSNLKSNGSGKHLDVFGNPMILLPHTVLDKKKINFYLTNYKIILQKNTDDFKIFEKSFCEDLLYIIAN